nr:reverse transcriptase domain-containing protein [Tanacetum cinerariifolium]
MIPPTSSPLSKEVERKPEATKDKVKTTNSGSTAHVQPLVVQVPIPEPDVALKPNPKPSIPYPSRLNNQKLQEKANNKMLKFLQIFQRLHIDLSFVDALLYMPKFASTFKSLLINKEKLFELENTPLNDNCSTVLLKKFPKKLRNPSKFLIPYDFLELELCLALVDLGASINLMPLFVWKKLSLPELTPTRMTLELANRSVAYPVGVAEDVFVKVGKFHFPVDFVAVDYDVDPQVPLILGRTFLRIARALFDVYSEELTLRVKEEAITINVGHTSRYSYRYDDESVNQIDVIDVTCEEYAQEVLGFSDSSTSGNPTPSDPIIATSSPSFTPFEGSDFILEEIETFLRTPDELSTLDDDFDSEGDIDLIEKLLNEDPSSNLPPMKNGDLKQINVTMTKPSIKEPPELELKDLPPHLEYAFLKGTYKLPVIISKELKDKEKVALLKVLMSHKRAIAWKISDIKGIDPRFCTHKILMEDDFKPVVKHQRRCMMAIFHDMIKEKMEVFMYDFLVFEDSFSLCLFHLDKMLKSHKISKSEIEVDKAKVDVIAKLPHPTFVKEKETLFILSKECIEAFKILKKKLTKAPILVAPDWDLPFEIMCDASDFVMGAVLGKRKTKHFQPIHYASKTITDAQAHYTTTEKELLAVVMLKYEVTHRLSTMYHPQTSEQVEVSNHGLKRIFERTVGENRASWSDKLDDAL